MPRRYRVALTDPHQHPLDSALLARLSQCGAILEAQICPTEHETIELCAAADAVMTSSARITRKVIERIHRCRIIARIGTGYDNVDHQAAGEAGIPVTN